jgi:hypothetical protein
VHWTATHQEILKECDGYDLSLVSSRTCRGTSNTFLGRGGKRRGVIKRRPGERFFRYIPGTEGGKTKPLIFRIEGKQSF